MVDVILLMLPPWTEPRVSATRSSDPIIKCPICLKEYSLEAPLQIALHNSGGYTCACFVKLPPFSCKCSCCPEHCLDSSFAISGEFVKNPVFFWTNRSLPFSFTFKPNSHWSAFTYRTSLISAMARMLGSFQDVARSGCSCKKRRPCAC